MKLNKEDFSMVMVLFLLLCCFGIAGYAYHMEQQYNECIVENYELSNPDDTSLLPEENGGTFPLLFWNDSGEG